MSPDRIRRRREQMRPDMAAMHDTTETVTCPHCEAQPDQPCTNKITGDVMHAPHHQRITAARRPQ